VARSNAKWHVQRVSLARRMCGKRLRTPTLLIKMIERSGWVGGASDWCAALGDRAGSIAPSVTRRQCHLDDRHAPVTGRHSSADTERGRLAA